MAYICFALIFFGWGVGLLLSDTGQLIGAKLPFNFGEYKNLAGIAFIGVGLALFRLARRAK